MTVGTAARPAACRWALARTQAFWRDGELIGLTSGYRDARAQQRLVAEEVRAITGTSARSIAATAGVNQALVFYHFGSVHDLLRAACLAATQARLLANSPVAEVIDTSGLARTASSAELNAVKGWTSLARLPDRRD